MSKTEQLYINKKDQAPSYCDRVLYKNNSGNTVEVVSYECLSQIHGSDHRPVSLSLRLKDFKRLQYYDLPKTVSSQAVASN